MKLKNLINKSHYCTIGHIGSESDLQLHERYILYNLPVLKEYKGHIVVTNYSGNLLEWMTEDITDSSIKGQINAIILDFGTQI